jgi:RF-1 domain
MPRLRDLSDTQLLAQCRVETFRGPGPGGQKRNKTSSAVRLTHQPSGISVTAGESRSQSQNRAKALRRLRHRMALLLRQPFEPGAAHLDISPRSTEYPGVMGGVLDALESARWSVSDAAALLATSTGKLVAFLRADPPLWTHVNRQRHDRDMRGLK